MDTVTEQLELPAGYCPLDTQVAGHTFQADTDALGLLKDAKTACVFKPLGKPACGEREVSFYESLRTTENLILSQAKTFVPTYFHKVKLLINQKEHTFIKLEDLTHGMQKPCIMDIKIGKRTWDPLASPHKKAVEEQKYTKCKQVLGLCLPGFQVYTDDNCLRYSKEFGKSIDAEGFRATIALFLNSQSGICKPLVQEILHQLYAIQNWFNKQTLLHFYASSLLVIYDYEQLSAHFQKRAKLNVENHFIGYKKHNHEPCDLSSWIKVRMIDFAHVFPNEQGSLDTNYLFGLQNLINILQELLAE